MPLDLDQFAELVATAIHVATAPLVTRIAVLEAKSLQAPRDGLPGVPGQSGLMGEKGLDGPPGRDGIDALPGPPGEPGERGEIGPMGEKGLDGAHGERGDIGPHGEKGDRGDVGPAGDLGPSGLNGEDGTSVTVEDMRPVIDDAVRQAVAAVPLPKDGTPGRDGTSVDLDALHKTVDALVIAQVAAHVARLPVPRDGTSVTVDDVAPLVASEVTKAVAVLPVPKDGVGLLGGVIDRAGHLVLTVSDGTVKDLGQVVGRDVEMSEVSRLIADEVTKIPRPQNGVDGKDGLGFDDLDFVDDPSGYFLRFARGEQVKEFRLPTFRDCGVFKAGTTYEAGNGVTWAGSFWIAQAQTSEKPGDGATSWRLAVKRGGEGKPGKDAAAIRGLR